MDEKAIPSNAGAKDLDVADPGRRRQALIALVVILILIGTPAISMTALSSETRNGTLEVRPGSHEALYAGIFGFGKIEYSFALASGPQIFVVEVDRRNFERLADGESYTYMGYETLSYGIGGDSLTAGAMWELFFVFVNDQSTTAYVEYDFDVTAYFNMIASGVILAVAGAVYALGVRYVHQRAGDSPTPLSGERLRIRVKALVAIALLTFLPVVIMVALGMLIPGDWGPMFGSAFQRFLFGALMTTGLTFLVRFRLRVVEGSPRAVLANLAHRLRVSRYSVTEKARMMSVQISSSASIKIMAQEHPEGTLLTYRASTTHSGLAAILILILFGYGIPIAFAVALIGLYRSCVFASDRVIPRLSLAPLAGTMDEKARTQAILIDSLSEGRRLSTEAYEAAKSNYHDSIIVSVTISVVAALVLALTLGYLSESLEASVVLAVSLSILLSVLSWRYLAKRAKPRLNDLQGWRTRFDLALTREIASQSPPDNEPSSFEMLAESLRELPSWLRILEKSGLYREPLLWSLILAMCIGAFELALVGLVYFNDDNLLGSVLMITSAALVLLCRVIYGHLKRRREEETRQTIGRWAGRIESIRSEMEKFLGGV